eukprot:2074626-Lingulodinium_polyedra.AAC.1
MSWHVALLLRPLARMFGHSEYTAYDGDPCWGSMLGRMSWHAGLAILIPACIVLRRIGPMFRHRRI